MDCDGGLGFSRDPPLMNKHLLSSYVSGSVVHQSKLLFGRTHSRLGMTNKQKITILYDKCS